MKKVLIIFISIITAAALAGGGYYAGYKGYTADVVSAIPKQSVPEKMPEKKAESTAAPDGDSGKYIGKSEASAVESTWSEIDSCKADVNGDGADEVIGLYTSAETDGGEILWDDSQKWVLEVNINGEYYILLNQSISNGRVYFDIDELKDGTNAITIYNVSAVGTSIKQYTYSKTGFVEKSVYNSESVNKQHSGIPAYK